MVSVTYNTVRCPSICDFGNLMLFCVCVDLHARDEW
jgi:hypothetical protein